MAVSKKKANVVVEESPTAETQVVEEEVVSETESEKLTIDMDALTYDIMENGFFRIADHEARGIAQDMVTYGKDAIHRAGWFLSPSERDVVANRVAQKYGLV